MIRLIGLWATGVAFVFSTEAASAGIHTTSDVVSDNASMKDCRMITYLDSAFFRFDNSCREGHSSMLFTKSPEMIYQIDHQKKSYSAMTLKEWEQTFGQMASQVKAMQVQMKASLAKVPAAQREAMMKMMGGAMASPPKLRKKKTGKTIKVGPYTCTIEEEWRGPAKVAENCIGDWKQFNIDINKYRPIGDSWKRLGEKMRESAGAFGGNVSETDMSRGYTVKHRSFNNGKVVTEVTLREIKETSLDPAVGKVPDGYAKSAGPFGKPKTK